MHWLLNERLSLIGLALNAWMKFHEDAVALDIYQENYDFLVFRLMVLLGDVEVLLLVRLLVKVEI